MSKVLSNKIELSDLPSYYYVNFNDLYKNGKINKLKGIKNNNKIETLWILKVKNGHIQDT